jgi:acyl-CoA synthetase (AMP-forming)/AMP-acid ligase II
MAKALVSFAGDLELGLNGAVVKSDTWNDNPFSLELRRTSVKQSRNEVIAGIIRGEDIAAEMTFSTMQDLVRDSNADCICGGSDDERLPLTHAGLRQFLTVGYPQILTSVFGGGEVPAQLRVCPVLPNGPEAAVCLVATVSFACCAPVSHASLASEVETELRSFGAQLVFVLDGADNAHVLAAAAALRCPVAALQPSATTAGIFTLAYVSGGILTTPPPSTVVAAAPEAEQYSVAELEAAGYSADQIEAYQAQHSPLPTSMPPPPAAAAHVTGRSNGVAWTQRHETALVLHTSGTSGAKKRVPYTLQGLVVGAQCIAQSWALCSSDVCCNMMPLFHVGGIARNVFAPLLTGGSVVCLPAFDAGAFWHALEHQGVTWYYAGPTMHQQIIQAREEGSQAAAARLRMVANAAGGLLPVLAEEIKRVH